MVVTKALTKTLVKLFNKVDRFPLGNLPAGTKQKTRQRAKEDILAAYTRARTAKTARDAMRREYNSFAYGRSRKRNR